MKKLLLVLTMWMMMAGAAFAQVNINTATKDQLDGLKGIGPAKAQAIIDYRTKNGPFKTVDDLEKVPGIGPAILKDVRSGVSVSGATVEKKADAKKDDKAAAKTDVKADAKADAKKDDKAAAKTDAKAGAKADAKKDDAKTDKK